MIRRKNLCFGMLFLLAAILMALPAAFVFSVSGVSDNLSKAKTEIKILRQQNNPAAAEEVRNAKAGIDARIAAVKADEKVILASLTVKKLALEEELISNLGLQDVIKRPRNSVPS